MADLSWGVWNPTRGYRDSSSQSDPEHRDDWPSEGVLRFMTGYHPDEQPMSTPTLSAFARGLTAETAFDVLAVAKKLQAAGKDVIALQIGDSPFPSTSSAVEAGKEAIDEGMTRYAPSLGVPEFRETIARTVKAEFGIPAGAENVVVAPGAKPF